MTDVDDFSAVPFVEKMHDELLLAEDARPRALQTMTGASQTFGCRAELVMIGNGVPQSDPSLGWSAWVGNAIHERLARQLAGPGRLIEERFEYRGVPATIDRYDEDDRSVTDYKSKDSRGEILAVRRDGPKISERHQVHLGAAALIEAGMKVDRVRLLYVPRSGDEFDPYEFVEPFDRALADAAADWHEETRSLTFERSGLPVEEMVEGLRDEYPSFCWSYCPRVRACRGEPDGVELDAACVEQAEAYDAARDLIAEGEARKRAAADFLRGRKGKAAGFSVTTYGGVTKPEVVEDREALEGLWREIYGADAALPTKEVESTSAVSLRVTRLKNGGAK